VWIAWHCTVLEGSQFSCTWKLEVEVTGEVQVIVEAIEDGTVLAVSDGSFKDGQGHGQSKADQLQIKLWGHAWFWEL